MRILTSAQRVSEKETVNWNASDQMEEENGDASDDQMGGATPDSPESAANDESDILIYFCKNCGHENHNPTEDNMCVLYTQIGPSDPQFAQVINKYTKYDPTLPRTSMHCPQQHGDVAHPKVGEYDVIYIRYDDLNMRFVYLCTICDTTFTNTI